MLLGDQPGKQEHVPAQTIFISPDCQQWMALTSHRKCYQQPHLLLSPEPGSQGRSEVRGYRSDSRDPALGERGEQLDPQLLRGGGKVPAVDESTQLQL